MPIGVFSYPPPADETGYIGSIRLAGADTPLVEYERGALEAARKTTQLEGWLRRKAGTLIP